MKTIKMRSFMEGWQLHHTSSEDFGRSCWQRGSSSTPLLLLRVLKLSFAVGVFAWSVASFWGPRRLWVLYMTHWGVSALVMESAFGVFTSVMAMANKLPDPLVGLPWYVKTYWVLFNISAPVAFLITLFYWSILYAATVEVEYAPNPVLDVSLHGLNSVVMLAELGTAGHPSRALHVYQPVGFGLVYLVFGVVYYLAGGLDPWGNPWVYPVIDWRRPQQTLGVVAATTVVLFLLHFLTVGAARLRDRAAARLRGKSAAGAGVHNTGYVVDAS